MRTWYSSVLKASVILVVGILTAGKALAAADPADRPNVLLILTDDQGYGDLAIHGHPFLQTPHLDQLALQSVRFDRFFVNSFCAPTRAGLLTGRWPLRTGCHGVTHNRETMRAEEVTVAELLRQSGYRTACIGKWHNGEQYPATPAGQGFEHVFGFNNGHWNNYFDAVLLRGHSPEPTSGYLSDVLTDDAIGFLKQRSAQPFFCFVSYNAPHSPYQVPDQWYRRFHEMGLDERLSGFFGMCENLDHNVGRLLQTLRDTEQDRNTIVIFLTDNGGTAGVRTWNAGMRGGKTSVHEGGSRVPLFVRWPAAGWSARSVQKISAQIDLLPTLADLCGATLPSDLQLDGISLRPLLEGNEGNVWQERVLFTHNPIDETNRYPGAVRTQQYRLVREIPGPAGGSRAVNRDADATPWQLYDMLQDPGQKQNVAQQYPDVVQKLSEQYERWVDETSVPRRERLPLPVGYAQHNPVELHAPQALIQPPLRFAAGPGFAHDWLTGWESVDAAVDFDLEVHQAGTFTVQLAFGCEVSDAGSVVQLDVANQQIRFVVPAGKSTPVSLPHRDQAGKQRYRNRTWSVLNVGDVQLPKGRLLLRLQPLSLAGDSVMDLKHVRLERK